MEAHQHQWFTQHAGGQRWWFVCRNCNQEVEIILPFEVK